MPPRKTNFGGATFSSTKKNQLVQLLNKEPV
jgi:hypothetical protein